MRTLNEVESNSEIPYWIPYLTKISPFYLHSAHINLDAMTVYTAITLKFVSNLLIIIPLFILWLSFALVSATEHPSYSHDFHFHFYVIYAPDQVYIIGHCCFIINIFYGQSNTLLLQCSFLTVKQSKGLRNCIYIRREPIHTVVHESVYLYKLISL
jgi:hypothetical protein